MFVGFVTLSGTINFGVVFKNSSRVPTNPSNTPSFRVYGNAGLQTGGTGTLTTKDTGVITGATNAAPIVITSASHGLNTGTSVTISGVAGNTAANGTFICTRIDANTFSLQSSTGNAPYTSGGVWNVSGLYNCSITPTSGNGYAQGGVYTVVASAVVGGNQQSQLFTFGVI